MAREDQPREDLRGERGRTVDGEYNNQLGNAGNGCGELYAWVVNSCHHLARPWWKSYPVQNRECGWTYTFVKGTMCALRFVGRGVRGHE